MTKYPVIVLYFRIKNIPCFNNLQWNAFTLLEIIYIKWTKWTPLLHESMCIWVELRCLSWERSSSILICITPKVSPMNFLAPLRAVSSKDAQQTHIPSRCNILHIWQSYSVLTKEIFQKYSSCWNYSSIWFLITGGSIGLGFFTTRSRFEMRNTM